MGRELVKEPEPCGYNANVESIRENEYPSMRGCAYLDHGGSTIPAVSLVNGHAAELNAHIFGNPHSHSTPAVLSSQRIDAIRQRTLRFFNADPKDFDLVFVANATAAIKLVMQSFHDLASSSNAGNKSQRPESFWYGYHRDAHTSIVGVRETTTCTHSCFRDDEEVEHWLETNPHDQGPRPGQLGLFAFPGQSNMTGRRLPLDWPGRLRSSPLGDRTYTLLDAAALATTAPLDLSDNATAPDFIALSFYKIFGYPDLGGLIVRKDSGHVLQWRRYFGGGTVDMVTAVDDCWHMRKDYTVDSHYSLHDQLEDGTLPFHSIMALDVALDVHQRLFGTMSDIARHTAYLTKRLHDGLSSLRHENGTLLCRIYNDSSAIYGDSKTQGATVAFNVQKADGSLLSYSEVERLADKHSIYVRSGGLCNPGGIATHLNLRPWEMKRAWSAGHRCGHATEIVSGKPTGVVRASLGAMSTLADVDALIDILSKSYVGQRTEMQAALPLRFEWPTAVPVEHKHRLDVRAEEVPALPESSTGSLDDFIAVPGPQPGLQNWHGPAFLVEEKMKKRPSGSQTRRWARKVSSQLHLKKRPTVDVNPVAG